jgi:hypothetical protein
MTPRAQKRIWIVAVLLVVFCGIYWAAPVPAQFRPPTPPVNPPPTIPPVGGNPKLPGFPPGANPNGPNNPLQPGIPKMPESVWRCSKCNAEVGRGAFPPEKCPHCGVKLINGFDPLSGNPLTTPPGGGNPPGINPNPNPIQPPVGGNPPLMNPNPNPVQPPGGVFQPANNPPVGVSPAPSTSSNASSSSGFGVFIAIIVAFLCVCGVVMVLIVAFWIRFIMYAAETASTPRMRARPRARRNTNDFDL